MVAYADATGCLRATILRYFGDPAAREPCGACGNCDRRTTLGAADLGLVRTILSGIAQAGERYGRRKIVAMLAGAVEDLPETLARLPASGSLRDERPRTIEHWIDAASRRRPDLRVAGPVPDAQPHGARPRGDGRPHRRCAVWRRRWRLSRRADAGRRVCGRPWPSEPVTRSRGRGRPASGPFRRTDAPDRRAVSAAGVGDALRAWRIEQARRRGVPPYVILHDRTLDAIASSLPCSRDELREHAGHRPRETGRLRRRDPRPGGVRALPGRNPEDLPG